MRTALSALAIVLAACGRTERARAPVALDAHHTTSASSGPDAILLRFPRAGGIARAFAYPRLDSLVWSSTDRMPPLERVLGFDEDAGSVAAVDAKGVLVRLDLRLGAVTHDRRARITHLSSPDGSTVFGVGPDGAVVRFTPSGDWTFKPPLPAHDVIPEPDGELLILAERDAETVVWQMRPPDRTLTDTAVMPRVTRAVRTQLGDRVYFTVDSGLIGLRSHGLETLPAIRLDHHVRAAATTPSGDRIYVALDSTPEVDVIDRYTRRVESQIALPGPAAELRMDPTGRWVLARPEAGDSAWVIDVGTERESGAVATAWRGDLPTVAPNGWLALLSGRDVVLVNGDSLRVERTVAGGAVDTWYFILWNGFRPSTSLPTPPITLAGDTAPRDTADTADTSNIFATPPSPAPPRAVVPETAQVTSTPGAIASTSPHDSSAGFTVQFGALRSADAARDLAQTIVVQGNHPRVIVTARDGIAIYRVVAGPFATKDEADRVARSSGASYWVYPGAP